MPSFRYVAVGPDGNKRTGEIIATTVEIARAELSARQLDIQSLKAPRRARSERPLKPEHVGNLSRQLSAFLRSGIPLISALEGIAEETKDATLREVVIEMSARLRIGDSFADAVNAQAQHFPPYFPAIVASAELSGNLDDVLDRLADYVDRDMLTRRKIKGAMTYPAILALLSLGTVLILVGFVLPKFEGFFAGFDAELPVTTKAMLSIGTFVKTKGIFLLPVLSLSLIPVALYFRSARGRMTLDRLLLRIPLVREVVQAAIIERFCRILGAMVRGGIPVSTGMAAAIASASNEVYRQGLVTASEAMMEGRGFAEPISETGLFPGMVTQMITVGEDTGTLDDQLDVAATYYERQLSFKLERLTAMFEPAILIVMGGVVGFVAIAMVQAMYGVYSQSGGV